MQRGGYGRRRKGRGGRASRGRGTRSKGTGRERQGVKGKGGTRVEERACNTPLQTRRQRLPQRHLPPPVRTPRDSGNVGLDLRCPDMTRRGWRGTEAKNTSYSTHPSSPSNARLSSLTSPTDYPHYLLSFRYLTVSSIRSIPLQSRN